MNKPQEHWDASLVHTWRRAGTLLDAVAMFNSDEESRGIDVTTLKRAPPIGLPWKMGVRLFVAQYLPKINDRLWDQSPEKDDLMLRKLAQSNYDTLKTAYRSASDVELHAEVQRHRRNIKRVEMDMLSKSNRNQATDWGVTKGPVRTRVRK